MNAALLGVLGIIAGAILITSVTHAIFKTSGENALSVCVFAAVGNALAVFLSYVHLWRWSASSLILYMNTTMQPPGDPRPYSILVVEDNVSDAYLLEKALEMQHIDFQLTHLRDGAEALAFIRREGPYAKAPRPDLILVNMNLPKVDGEEIVHQIRGARRLDGVPVWVWSSSDLLHGGESFSRLGADGFILKPSGLERFMEIGKTVKDLLSRGRS
jgi:CheY-like chemotaxis protein